MGVENARRDGHLTGNDPVPKLYSNNGPGLTSKVLGEYLSQLAIKHIFCTPGFVHVFIPVFNFLPDYTDNYLKDFFLGWAWEGIRPHPPILPMKR